MSDHGLFSSILLDVSEKESIKKALDFSEKFASLEEEATASTNETMIIGVLNKSLELMTEYKKFQIEGVVKILNCQIKSIILPLVAEHDLRELNHYMRILNEGKNLIY